ncbi:hypothetical protein V3N99_05745 [Dermatophilaceae bacterium Soc4.6]
MSKADDTRAMREARHAAFRARAAQPTATPKASPKAPGRAATAEAAEVSEPSVTVPPAAPVAPDEQAGLCGHRAMSGRTCTREQGHAAKSHRYS